jgi:hypothetical protein
VLTNISNETTQGLTISYLKFSSSAVSISSATFVGEDGQCISGFRVITTSYYVNSCDMKYSYITDSLWLLRILRWFEQAAGVKKQIKILNISSITSSESVFGSSR